MENARAWWVIFEQSLKVKKNGFLFGCESSPEVLDLPKLMNRKMGFSWLPIGQFLGPMRIFEKIFGKIQRENPKKVCQCSAGQIVGLDWPERNVQELLFIEDWEYSEVIL